MRENVICASKRSRLVKIANEYFIYLPVKSNRIFTAEKLDKFLNNLEDLTIEKGTMM